MPTQFLMGGPVMLIVAALLAATGAQAQTENAWVIADVLVVRQAPRADAPVVGRLRINTQVERGAAEKGWSAVDYRGEVRGWASAAFLAKAPLDPAAVRAEVEAQTGAARLASLERLVALAPGDRAAWEALRTAKQSGGRRAIEAMLAGGGRVYIATCESEGPVLLAVFEPGQGLTPLLGAGARPDLLGPLAQARWFGDVPPPAGQAPASAHTYELAGTPFHSPKLGKIDHIQADIPAIRLASRCTDDAYGDPPSGSEPSVFVSSPMVVAPHAGLFDWSRAGKVASAVKRAGAGAPSQLRVDAVPVGGRRRWSIHASSSGAERWLLTGDDLKPLPCSGAPAETCLQGEAVLQLAVRPHPWGWLVPAFAPERYAIQVARWGDAAAATGEAGVTIVVVEASGRVHALSLVTFQSGC